jgi:hypothetical protein
MRMAGMVKLARFAEGAVRESVLVEHLAQKLVVT